MHQRTKGPKDQGTTLPEDPQTTRPGEQQKRPIKQYCLIRIYFLWILFIFVFDALFFFDTYAFDAAVVEGPDRDVKVANHAGCDSGAGLPANLGRGAFQGAPCARR